MGSAAEGPQVCGRADVEHARAGRGGTGGKSRVKECDQTAIDARRRDQAIACRRSFFKCN